MTIDDSNPGFDFFATGELPAPSVSRELAERWAEDVFGPPLRQLA